MRFKLSFVKYHWVEQHVLSGLLSGRNDSPSLRSWPETDEWWHPHLLTWTETPLPWARTAVNQAPASTEHMATGRGEVRKRSETERERGGVVLSVVKCGKFSTCTHLFFSRCGQKTAFALKTLDYQRKENCKRFKIMKSSKYVCVSWRDTQTHNCLQ